MDHTIIYQADLDFPCKELSVCSLNLSQPSFSFFGILCVRILREQSSCMYPWLVNANWAPTNNRQVKHFIKFLNLALFQIKS